MTFNSLMLHRFHTLSSSVAPPKTRLQSRPPNKLQFLSQFPLPNSERQVLVVNRNMTESEITKKSTQLRISIPTPSPVPASVSPAYSSDSACAAYDHYLRLPELRRFWIAREFPAWRNEPILKPALQALEITFRFVSLALSDTRPYANRREWRRRLESLATSQIELIANLIEDEHDDGETRGTAPIVDLNSAGGVLARQSSYAEVWKIPGEENTVVNRTSECSLLPRLTTWQKSEDVAQKILYSIECEFRRCPYTLGLGEPNLAGKPSLDYDAVCKPTDIHVLKKTPFNHVGNLENPTLYTTHQILESWIQTGNQLLKRISERIDSRSFRKAAIDCNTLEKTWKLLAEIEDLHLLMDPDDFLHLKSQLLIRSSADETVPFLFRSKGLVEMTKLSKGLKHNVPSILCAEVDPSGGPSILDAAMRLYGEKKEVDFDRIHLVQGLQAIEGALKGFFFAYKQLLGVVMGSVEAKANSVVASSESGDALSQVFLEPTYFPSLDAAKTFLGDFWSHQNGRNVAASKRK